MTETGPRGRPGAQGEHGIQGEHGDTGPRGPRGLHGPAITPGAKYGLAVLFVSMLLMTVINIQYTDWRARRADQRWCAIITSMDDTYQTKPPESDTGKQMATNMHQLRIDLGCK